VVPLQQLEGEPAHHRVRQRDQHTRSAVAHRAAVAWLAHEANRAPTRRGQASARATDGHTADYGVIGPALSSSSPRWRASRTRSARL
jgi:hypothetical protein